MARKPAPTKANLFKAQHDLRFATEGCELLHQKRDVLVMELMSVTASFADAEQALRKALHPAFEAFVPAYLTAGQEGLARLFPASRPEAAVTVEERGVMGTQVPEVALQMGDEVLYPGLLDMSADMDGAIAGMSTVMEQLSGYVQTVATIWRLATEVEKTQRRINAIENVFIPESQETVDWIKSVMEENDREELFRRKLLKNRSSQTGEGHGRESV